jgi:gamma-glutamyltranspeptidase
MPESFTGAIATPHTSATDAAVAVFADGGTAIDAAIAAAAVLTVVYPHNVALGGDLIALVRAPGQPAVCVNASGWSAAATDVAAMRSAHGSTLPARGADPVTVPGGVRGWESLRRFGSRLPWSRLLEPAERVAAAGVPLAPSVAASLVHPENADLIGTGDFDRVFAPDGRPLRAGELFRQPQLATTFAALRAGGPDEFYRGGLAERTVQFLRSAGSRLDAADLADFEPELCEPISIDHRGLRVLTSPPNTHGFLMLRALKAVEDHIADPVGAGIGALMRAFHQGNRVRTALLADPRQADVDVAALIHGEVPAAAGAGRPGARGDTVGIAAADSDGVAVSLIQSVYDAFGSGLIDPQTGILFHNRGTGFSLDAGSPNVLAPRKRPAHTLMPVMTMRDDRVRHVLATMGGQGQPQILTQLLLHMLDGATAADAVAAPRAIVGPQLYGGTDDSLVAETGIDDVAAAALAATGFDVLDVPRHTEALGHANAVQICADGAFAAAADPRADGSAVVAQYARHVRNPLSDR